MIVLLYTILDTYRRLSNKYTSGDKSWIKNGPECDEL